MNCLHLATPTLVAPSRHWLSMMTARMPRRRAMSRRKIFKIPMGKERRNAVCPLPLKTPRSFRKNMTNVSETATPVVEVSEMPAGGQAAVEGDNTASRPRGSGRKLRTPFRRRRGDAVQQQSGQQGSEGTDPEVQAEDGGTASAGRRRPASKARKSTARNRAKPGVAPEVRQDEGAGVSADSDLQETGAGRNAQQRGQRRGRKAESPEADREADMALSYLERSAALPQRLGKYLNSEA